MRRVILIVIIAGVVGATAAGVWWFFIRNRDVKTLARAELAIQAKNYEKAIALTKDYIARRPGAWEGYYVQARAQTYLGQYEEARRNLEEALKIAPTRVDLGLSLADTYSVPARRAMVSPEAARRSAPIEKAIEYLRQANTVLTGIQTTDAAALADVAEGLGLNSMEIGLAQRRLAEMLKKEAEIAASAGQADVRKAKEQASQTAAADAEQHLKEATGKLLAAVQRDPSRDRSADALVRLCVDRKDTAGLEAARKAILGAADPPPVAATTLIMYDLRPTETDDRRETAQKEVLRALATLEAIQKKHPAEITVQLARAELSLRVSDFAKVEEICQGILKGNARQAQPQLLLASALMMKGEWAKAEQALFTLKTDFPLLPQAHLAYAQAAMATGKKELAREALRTVANLDPTNAAARRFLADSLMREGYYKQAFPDAKALFDLHPEDPAAVRLFVEAAVRTNQPDIARQALESTRKQFAGRADVLMAAAEGYGLMGDTAEAKKTAAEVAALKPTTADDRLVIARALIFIGRLVEAEAALNSLIASNPEAAAARFALGRLYYQTGRPVQAIEHYRGAVQAAPAHPTYRLTLAKALFDGGLLDEAETEVQHILGRNPGDADANLLATQIKIFQGESPSATAALEHLGGGAKQGLPLAMTYLVNGQPDQTVQVCLAELKKSPEDLEARSLLGEAYLALDQKQKCIDEWTTVLKAAPDRVTTYLRLAGVWSADAKTEDVQLRLAAIPGARPYLVDLAVGGLHDRNRNYAGAAEAYGRLAARSDAPEGIQNRARHLRATSLSRAGQVDRAIVELDQLATKKDWQNKALYTKAQILVGAQRTQEAAKTLADLVRAGLEVKDVGLLGRTVALYLQSDQKDKALAVCDAMDRLFPNDARPALVRANVLTEMGRRTEAIDWYRKTIDRQPANLTLYMALADLLETEYRPDEALQVLTSMTSLGPAAEAVALFERGALLARWGFVNPAVAALEELARTNYATSPRLQIALAQAFGNLGQKNRAREILQKVPKFTPQYTSAQQMLVDLADKDEDKLAILKQLDEARPGLPGVLLKRLSIFLKNGRHDDIVKEFQALVKRQSADAPLPEGLAALALHSMLKLGNLAAATDLCERLGNETQSTRWRHLTILLASEDQPERAQALLARAPEAGFYHDLIGMCVAARTGASVKDWYTRLQEYQQKPDPSKTRPPVPPTHLILAAFVAGETADAESVTATFQGAGPVRRGVVTQFVADAKTNRAVAADAVRLLKASLAADMGVMSLARIWAFDLLKTKPTCQWAAAIATADQPDTASLRDALRLVEPKDCTIARRIQAELFIQEGQDAKAAEAARLAYEADPKDLDLLSGYATATERAGDLPAALALYRQLWEKAKSPLAANNAAYVTAQLFPKDAQKLAEASAWAEAAVKAMPRFAAYHDTLGWVAYLQGKTDQAAMEFRRAVRGMPDSPEVQYHAGLAEIQAGRTQFGRWHLEAAVTIGDRLRADGAKVPDSIWKTVSLAREALDKMGKPKS